MKVPEVKRCCFCFSLRQGVIFFGFVNVVFSLVAVTCLVITTELKKSNVSDGSLLEAVTATILFSIFGMGVILNILLLVAGFQKDIAMLRLYLYYGAVTTLAALVPTFMLLSKMHVFDVCVASFAICMQWYLIVIVRSEILKLEESQMRDRDAQDVIINVHDRDTLL
ncbi:unnamed protein product [Arctia plantaginis]|uniref:Uncharacterized protein n=1 Tax=Arctia plantaginis TaxID=874455 RepID=A0A8S0ZF14_ARCPL|nr:unnamed protein product [Arctia plantaginis]